MKGVLLIGLLLVNLCLFASAAACDPAVTLVNQDPYPAVPGDSAKLVFQIEGLSSTECGDVIIQLVEKYPITVDPSTPSAISLKAGTYTTSDYQSFVMAPYKVRVAEDALDGETPVELLVSTDKGTEASEFNMSIEDTRATFEVNIKDYNPTTRELTFEILNTADTDIKALSVEVPKQANIEVKGANRIIAGDLDSNEFTTADFEAIPKDGPITLNLYYSDAVDVRRTDVATVVFDSSYFTGRIADQKTTSTWTYIFYIVVIAVIAYIIYRVVKKRRNKR